MEVGGRVKYIADGLDKIEKRDAKIKSGVWEVSPGTFKPFLGERFFDVLGTVKDEDGDVDLICRDKSLEVAEYIAASRVDIPKLVASVKILAQTSMEVLSTTTASEDKTYLIEHYHEITREALDRVSSILEGVVE
jgi:hypothetical protein